MGDFAIDDATRREGAAGTYNSGGGAEADLRRQVAQAGAPPQGGTQQAAPQSGKSCAVVSGPTYTPSGTINPSIQGNQKQATFNMDAKFAKDQTHDPSCCSFHQDLKWDQAYQNSHGGFPPHIGFPNNATAGNWYEDRDDKGAPYGDRNHPANFGQYTTNGVPDPQHGDTFHAQDNPFASIGRQGTWDFRATVTDSCHGNAPVAPAPGATPTVKIPW